MQMQVKSQAMVQPSMQPQAPAPPRRQAQLQPSSQVQMQPQTQSFSQPELQEQQLAQAARPSADSYRDYQVGPEDLLVVEVLGQKDLNRELRVNGLGQISMPLVGVINVGGLTTQQIQQHLMEAYGSQYLNNPQITVEVKEFHHQRVAVTGAVAKPGYYDIIGPRTLLEVLAMAGGVANKPGPEAADIIQVMKNGSSSGYGQPASTLVINTRALISGQNPNLNVMVKNGDVVYVPFAGTAYVTGGVRKPTNVTVKDNLTVTQAVAEAQGVEPTLGTDKVIIMRFDQQGRPIKIEADLKDITLGKETDIPVKNNDTIVVVEGTLKKKLYVIRQLLPIPSGGYSIPTR